ncbi:hypothetical protein [Lactococcus petauri]|uniref:LXG domain-containing protein n=1 Tax=Lactococcus petauri TaxID=1940789 RepID=A0ABZ2SHQ5_9LACT|nr:hypothetical protein [Lactococcus petauri]OAL09672.1 hypothetical protein A7X72_00704 [Lactococcus garvieae]MCV5951993.1 hypothetical protein [Lactococcus petauri]MCV5966534.1 hypothetical protein [Lactococcus petauri]MCV5969412.1 hypothetical protein [Lactococcus petauri]MCV5979848.1 hypothetical protein [Lactococcus petauri]
MNKDYLTSPFSDEAVKSIFKNLMEANKSNTRLIDSVQSISSIVEGSINDRKQMIDAINSTMPKVSTMAIPPDVVKQINNSSRIAEDLQKIIISSQVIEVSELTKNITQSLDSLKHVITPNVYTYQTDLSKIASSIESVYSNIDISNTHLSFREDQKICSEKYEINDTIDTYTEKNYNPVVQENDNIQTLGILLGKFITSYQKVKQISSHTYTLASENKIALTIYANSFTLLVEYLASITNPIIISLAMSIITTMIIHLNDINKK